VKRQIAVIAALVVVDVTDRAVQKDVLANAGLLDTDEQPAAHPHSIEAALPGDRNAAGIGHDTHIPQAQILGQRPEEHLPQIEKRFLRTVGAAFPFASNVAEVLLQQNSEAAHVVFLRLH